jgi:hypothetical protein
LSNDYLDAVIIEGEPGDRARNPELAVADVIFGATPRTYGKPTPMAAAGSSDRMRTPARAARR